MVPTNGRWSTRVAPLLLAGLAWAGPTATASAITVQFPSDDSTVVASVGFIDADEIGYFWKVSRGDSVTEGFTGTGLSSVTGLDLEFDVTQNVLASGAFTHWDVLLNGISVGDWMWTALDGIGHLSLSYLFPAIVGDGDYTIRMAVLNEVAPGAGSIALGFPGEATLTGTAAPEPGTLGLIGAGLLGIAFGAPRRRA